MADREKVRLMARLAMLEKHSGRRIRKAENTSRIDLITNPVWRWGLFVTLLFFALTAALAVLNMDMVLEPDEEPDYDCADHVAEPSDGNDCDFFSLVCIRGEKSKQGAGAIPQVSFGT